MSETEGETAGRVRSAEPPGHVSIIVPARNQAHAVRDLVTRVIAQGVENGVDIEVLVVDDGSSDATAEVARQAGARVLRLPAGEAGGNPARARNRGAAAADGDPLIFLDADCMPRPDWLRTLLAAHDRGAAVVGGAFELAPGLPATARCDYYAGWYHVHGRRAAGLVSQHPPGNLSVRRAVFRQTCGFTETHPVAYAHEELAWQAQAVGSHGRIAFEPGAGVEHHNRPGIGNLLRRNYRWGYSAIESKAAAGTARWPWLYRNPRLLVVSSLPLAAASSFYVIAEWLRAGRGEPLLMSPGILAARLAYAAGMIARATGRRRGRDDTGSDQRPRWE
ncbi:MAG: glycosyltransferase family 2 protein [Gemmatimonadota bacterium]